MPEFFYHGFWRMDWGLGNPNKTAALIAILMVAVWGLAYVRRWGFWIALVLFTGLGVCLIDTFSRGGLIALCSGLVVLLWKLPRPWPIVKIGAVVISFWIIIGASIYLQAYARYGQGVSEQDRSITHRIELWEKAPQMMVDAPGGWGLGNSGAAYTQWYQPITQNEKYRTLVNSHLTWMVEFGWPLRFLYLCGWITALVLCWPSKDGKRTIPFAIWIVFLVGAFFSSVAESPWLWIVPVFSLGIAIASRFSKDDWPRLSSWFIAGGVSALLLISIFIIGSRTETPKIHKFANHIEIGNGSPKTWVLIDQKVIGENYGKTLRQWLRPSDSIGLVQSAGDIPPLNGKTLVVCGNPSTKDLERLRSIALQSQKIVLLNPAFFPQQLPIDSPSKAEIVFGVFSQSPAVDAWSGTFGQSVSHIEGAGDYLPKWPTFFLTSP